MGAGDEMDERTRGRRPPLWWTLILSSALPLLLSSLGCGVYSFSQGALPEELRTVAIPLAEDRSVGGVPDLDRTLTELLTDRFVRRTRLRLEPDERAGDAVLTATIDGYANQPESVTGADVAALNRVTLRVRVVLAAREAEPGAEPLLDRSFTGEESYDASNLDQETVAATEALRKIVEDAYTAATSDW